MARARVTRKITKKAAPPPAPRGTTRRERRRRSSRLLSRIGIGLALLLPLLYFAFTKLLFNPFEDSQPPFAVLAPRDVALYLHRERLDSDIEEFPRPSLYDRLQRTREWKALQQTAWFEGLEWPRTLEATFAEIEQVTAQAPLDPMKDLLGRELAVVGRWDPGGAPAPATGNGGEGGAGAPALRVAALMRVSDWAKLLVEALDFDAGLQKAFPDAELVEVEDPDVPGVAWKRLERPGEAPLFYARELDLLVIGEDETLVRDVLRTLPETARESSLGLTRLYLENLAPLASVDPEARLSLELAFDPRPLLPPPTDPQAAVSAGPDATINLLKRLLDPAILRSAVAHLEVDEAVSLRAHAELDAELAAARRTGLLGTESFRAGERLAEAFDHLPNDCAAVITANLQLKPLLAAFAASLDPDVLQLLDSTLKDLARYSPGFNVDELSKLIDYLDRTLTGEVTIALRPVDHAIPAGSQPLPLLAFSFVLKDADRWRKLDEAVVRGHKAFGIEGQKMFKQNEGVGERKWLGLPPGLPIEEISYIVLDGTKAVVTTDDDFLREIVLAYANSRDSLGAEPEPRALRDRLGDARANLAAWASVESLQRIMEPYAEYVAERDTILDFGPLRQQARAELLKGQFREWLGKEDQMPEDAKAELDAQLDAQMNALEEQRLAKEVPALAAAWREKRQWLSLLDQVALAVRLGERDADLAVQATTALSAR